MNHGKHAYNSINSFDRMIVVKQSANMLVTSYDADSFVMLAYEYHLLCLLNVTLQSFPRLNQDIETI